jgi:uncharacterized delta-60 repeat protein
MIKFDLPTHVAILVSLLVLLSCGYSIRTQAIQLDGTFSSDGKVTVVFGDTGLRSSHALSVFTQPSGRIVITGNHVVGGNIGTPAIAASGLTAAGDLDAGFGTGGRTLDLNAANVYAVEQLPNGQWLRLIALFTPSSTTPALHRMNLNGSVDGSFAADLNVGSNAVPVSVRLRPDGKILVLLRGVGGDESQWLVRLNANGGRDTSFGTNGVLLLNLRRLSRFGVNGMHVLSDNRMILGGEYSTFGGPSGANFAWAALLDEGGHYDRRFGLQGLFRVTVGSSLNVLKTLVQPDGKFVLIGVARSGGLSRSMLIRLTSRGRLDPGFGVNGIVVAPNVTTGSSEVGYSGALMPDGRIVVVGTYAASQTSPASFLVSRFSAAGLPETHTVTEFTPGHHSIATDVTIQADGKLVVVGSTRNPDASADGNIFAIARYTQ